ncbi:MAG: helicase-related protein [Polyangiaceae bacterium]
MTHRNREWLRGFLRLDARADAGATVPERDVERQEDTVLRALSLLDEQPGVVLADEVGMGKTYEALGVVAARQQENPNARTVILTPGPDLNQKWEKELRAFGDRSRTMYAGFRDKVRAATNLASLIRALDEAPIVVAPVNIFAGSRATADQAYLLSAWATEQGLAGNQIAALFKRYRDGQLERIANDGVLFLDAFDWARMERPLKRALASHRRAPASLNALYEEGGYDAFKNQRAVDAALADLKFRVLSELVPTVDLLVVDEAHKLKNSESLRATGVRTVFGGRFDKALFLTATPFQLTVDELRQVFALFALARNAPVDLEEQAERLLDDVAEYTRAYNDFEALWRMLDGAGVADFTAWFARDPSLKQEPDDPALRAVVAHGRRLLQLKQERIEPGFRGWMIRSLREDKREYRKSDPRRVQATGGDGVPFMLYERFIAELFRTKARTHKAAVQINMVSSYGAARDGALFKEGERGEFADSAEAYRKLLRGVLGKLEKTTGGHPKVAHVVRDAVEAAERDEKTLIFCARVATLHELKREIEAEWDERMLGAWQRVFPGAQASDIFDTTEDESRIRGRHSKLRNRFQRPQDALYLALRERYVPTLLEASGFAEEHLGEIVDRANQILRGLKLPKAHAERADWSLLKRCVEQATALAMRDAGGADDVEPEVMERILDPRFVLLGFDLEADDVESFTTEGDQTVTWSIKAEDAQLVIPKVHLWSHLKSPLFHVPADLRVRTVERLAAYLVSRYVPFLPDLLSFAKEQGVDVESIEARTLVPVIDRYWTTPTGRRWCDQLRRFLVYMDKLDEAHRKEVLDDVLKAGAIVRHTVDGESRERLREAFNTPLYPMVLVANEVMQEGLDLHHHCRRVIHHDLAWNPAQLEQRVGRVDRLGSLVARERLRRPDTTLTITLPLIRNTIDERLERTVRMRERWMEFLLGAPPNFDEYGLADEPVQSLPVGFAEALRVELGPWAKTL